jgi:PTS system nitrogen regulatory IIA component
MNLISRHLQASHIVLDAPYVNKKRAFEAIAQLFEDHNKLARSAAYDALFTRERMGSTGLGHGVAIPHGRVKGLKDTLCAVVRLVNPIPFEALDNVPVKLMIVLMVPENANQKHLDLLGELAALLTSETFRDSLMNAPTPADLHRVFLTAQVSGLTDI